MPAVCVRPSRICTTWRQRTVNGLVFRRIHGRFEMRVSEYVHSPDPCQQVGNLEGLMAAMLHQLAEHPLGDMVILFTNPTIGSTGTGNTYALFISKNGNIDRHVFLDTHPPKGEGSRKLGAVRASKMRSNKLEEDIATLAMWIGFFPPG